MQIISEDGTNRRAHIAVLVLEAFRGARPEGMEACHNDGNPENNRLNNLRWDTHVNNMADIFTHGTVLRGERANNNRLAEDEVRHIRALAGKETQMKIAERFGIDQTTVSDIVRGRIWSWLK